jgi:hypothetical protein
MGHYLTVYLFESEAAYREYKRAHDGSLENAPTADATGQQNLDLGLYNDWKGSAVNLGAVFHAEARRARRVAEPDYTLLRILAWILDDCRDWPACYVVIRNA